MNREPALGPTNSSQSASLADRSPEPAELATIALQSGTSARVVDQLDKLSGSLDALAGRGRAAASPAAADDEECLESYLQRYMQQLTGKAAEKPPEKTTSDSLIAVTTVNNQLPEQNIQPQPQRQPVAAPEDRLQITAMRELANDSARRAMAQSTQIQLVIRTRTIYLAAKVVSIASSALAVAYLATHSTIALASAAAFFGIACLLGVWFVGLCKKVGRMSAAAT